MKRGMLGGALLMSMLACREANAEDAGVLVFLRASPETKLERREAAGKWSHVCNAPCGVRVDRNARYHLRGGEIRGDEEVTLGDGDEVTIVLEQRPSKGPKVGRTIATVGGIAAGVAAAVFAVSVYAYSKSGGGCLLGPCTSGQSLALLGIGVGFGGFVGGTITSIVGGVIWAAAPTTKLEPTIEPRGEVIVPVAFAW